MDGSSPIAVTDAPHLTMAAILDAVSVCYDVSVPLLKGPNRSRSISWPRQSFCWLAYNAAQWSLPQIGQFLNHRDHTTIIHAIKAVNKRNALDPQHYTEMRALSAQLSIPEARPSMCKTCGQRVN